MFTQFAAHTNIGKVRQNNEDCFSVRPDLGLGIVADGMGGHEKGQLASKMACDLICQHVENGEAVVNAIEHAHKKIQEQSWLLGQVRNMGTTVVAIKKDNKSTEIFWVGDSRAYVFSSGKLQLLSNDHSLVQKLLDRHLITEEEALSHPHRNMITQSLGMMSSRPLEIGRRSIDANKECTILLCSDGLSNELTHEQITAILNQNGDLETKTTNLITNANLSGGHDNITAMLIQL